MSHQPEAAAADPAVEAPMNYGSIRSEDRDEAPLASMSMSSEPNAEDIRNRAYQRFLERGGGHGLDFEDWLEAERELRRQH
jgi:DUF2934 family protein